MTIVQNGRPDAYTIAEASDVTGASIDTLRYYERASVLPRIARTSGGQRSYTADDLGWVVFVRRLRATGMSMRRIAEYTALVRAGDGTRAERRRLLEDHRATVLAALDELTEVREVLDRKIAHYAATERGVDLPCTERPLRHIPQLT